MCLKNQKKVSQTERSNRGWGTRRGDQVSVAGWVMAPKDALVLEPVDTF